MTPETFKAISDSIDEERFMYNAGKCGLPGYMHKGLLYYFKHGLQGGDFLTAVLSNDLREAAMHADETNKRLLWEYVFFLYNYAPIGTGGSPEAVEEWLTLAHEVREAAQSQPTE